MEIKELIVKFERNNEDKETMLIYDKSGEYIFKYGNSIEKVIAYYLKQDIKISSAVKYSNLSNLEKIIQQGYSIQLDRIKERYVLVVCKDGYSKYYTADKEDLLDILLEANWDYEFISELEETNVEL